MLLAPAAINRERMAVEEDLLKALVSGEPRVVNRKYLPALTFFPSAKLLFATNHLPPIADTSAGIWRRMIVTPFNERFDGARCDLSRKDRLLEESWRRTNRRKPLC